MSSTTIFKRLFEVQILHDYYLTAGDGVSFFDKNKAEKEKLLSKKIEQGMYDVKDLFEIASDQSAKQLLDDYKMVMFKTALGFVIGIEVAVENKAGETLYKPRIKVGADFDFIFSLKPNAPFFKSITNMGLRPALPAQYYFTNKDKEAFNEATTPPYTSFPISNSVDQFQKNKEYEMGTLASFRRKVKEALQFTTVRNAKHWKQTEDKRFVNDADRILLPHRFTYRIPTSQEITEIVFVLAKKNGDEIKTITKTGDAIRPAITLDLSKVEENNSDADSIPSGFYDLIIKTNTTTEITYPVYLNDTLYNKESLATIDIRFNEENSAYSLLDTEGFLKTRIGTTGEKIEHPVFEIRLKNRNTYWRYNKEGDFSPDEIATTASFLDHEPEKLISIQPKALTEALVPFQNGSSLLLPHPEIPSIRIEKDRVFSEIFINQSNRLLNN